MAIERLGYEEKGHSASATVTVPSDCTLALYMTGYWIGDGNDIDVVTLNGTSFTKKESHAGSSGVNGSIALWYLQNPSTGSQTLVTSNTSDWINKPGLIVYFKGCATGDPFRDTGWAYGYNTTITSGSFDVENGDLAGAVGFLYGNSATDDINMEPSGSGQTEIAEHTTFDTTGYGEKAITSSGTTTMQCSGDSYVTIIAWSLMPAAAASTVPPLMYHYMHH